MQVLYLGNGLREHQEGREERESRRKDAKMSKSVLKQVTSHGGRHCGTWPRFVPLRGIYPPTPHLLFVKACSQGHEPSSISGLLFSQVQAPL